MQNSDLEIRIEEKKKNINGTCTFFSINLSFSIGHQSITEFPRVFNSVYLSYLEFNMQLWRRDVPSSCQQLNHPINIQKQNLIYITHIHFSVYVVSYPNFTNKYRSHKESVKLVAQKITVSRFLEAIASFLTTRQFFVSIQHSFNS